MAVPQERLEERPELRVEPDRSTAELVRDLTELVPRLVREELALAGAELRDKGRSTARGAGMFGAAGALAWFGLGALVVTAIAALALVWPLWLSALVVAMVLLAVAGGFALAGRSRISRALPPAPQQTIESVKDDVAAVKRSVHR